MMKLILSLTLIWMLSSTADALRCLYTDLGNLRVNQTCDSDGDMCAFIPGLSYDLNGQNSSSIVRSCVPSSLCTNPKQKFSFRLGPNVAISSVHCCNTDYCNSQNVSNPEAKLQKNGLQCASCSSPRNDASCNVTVDCMGDQDRCINGTAEIQEFTYRFLGCASATVL
ncbi:phospholipase A2 inhibitor and Ly6/PLAUR domain-containing protein-like isoform X2 [Pempheris klunzingeri]|uniref:phospholipase A2 inhibitor and Ly6/PLAUR domain-containing protein-like isoform X2 n=1 Tax=Pempheris klunzingeri TaxID=3127111 RepID=UPI00398190A4